MADPNFKFGTIETLENRQDFLNDFLPLSVKATPAPQKPPAKPPVAPAIPAAVPPPPTKLPKPKLDTNVRTTLAPKTGSRTMSVAGTRLNSIYKECRKLEVQGNENACALLLRVFIELSTEAFLSEKSIAIPPNLAKNGKTHWGDFGISLADKITCAVDYLDPTKKAKPYQQARLDIQKSTSSVSSITTLHGYFHNLAMIPDETALKKAWDAWEAYLISLHKAR